MDEAEDGGRGRQGGWKNKRRPVYEGNSMAPLQKLDQEEAGRTRKRLKDADDEEATEEQEEEEEEEEMEKAQG